MAVPTIDTLTEQLDAYVEGKDNPYVKACVEEAVTFIGSRFDPSVTSENAEDYIGVVVPDRMQPHLYEREVKELGADLFFRRQARNGIVGVNAMDGMVARISKDPWASSEARLVRFLGLGFA